MNKEINLFHNLPSNFDDEKRLEREKKLKIKRIIEALLFASSEPISFLKLREIVNTYYPVKPHFLKKLIEDLQEEYLSDQRSFRLEEVSLGFILKSLEEYSPFIEQLFRNKRGEKLSPASTEVLAIIAYKNPITRPQIDAIRGVDSSGSIQNLLERGLIQQVGKLEAPGRPALYGITDNFLMHFGLRDLQELPAFE